jgi:protocatechuate 3,4-dioxygenase beta subunit
MSNESSASNMTEPRPDRLTRRDIITAGAGVVGLASLAVGGGFLFKQIFPQRLVYGFPQTASAQPTTLDPTPACGEQPPTDSYEEGPFYVPDTPLRTDFRQPGHHGQEMIVRGRVLDTDCNPIPNAVLDLWQVNEDGVYDNLTYRYRGHQYTREDGTFELRTLVPVPYYFAGLWRAAHIHLKAQGPQTRLLTSQMFFPNDPAGNARDFRFDPNLLVDMRTLSDGSADARFNIVLRAA